MYNFDVCHILLTCSDYTFLDIFLFSSAIYFGCCFNAYQWVWLEVVGLLVFLLYIIYSFLIFTLFFFPLGFLVEWWTIQICTCLYWKCKIIHCALCLTLLVGYRSLDCIFSFNFCCTLLTRLHAAKTRDCFYNDIFLVFKPILLWKEVHVYCWKFSCNLCISNDFSVSQIMFLGFHRL